MLTGILEEQGLEVRTARGQHHLVRLDRVSITGECHVHERFALEELIEHVGQIALVVVPAQAELLRRACGVLHGCYNTQEPERHTSSVSHTCQYINNTTIELVSDRVLISVTKQYLDSYRQNSLSESK